MGGVTGDFGRLQATIAAVAALSRVPSRVAALAAPRLAQQARNDTTLKRDPYGRAYAPHKPATTRRWGAHPLLNLTSRGISSITAAAMSGAGVSLSADDHMTFTQTGTKHQKIRAIFPNNPTLPAKWAAILERCTTQVFGEALSGVK